MPHNYIKMTQQPLPKLRIRIRRFRPILSTNLNIIDCKYPSHFNEWKSDKWSNKRRTQVPEKPFLSNIQRLYELQIQDEYLDYVNKWHRIMTAHTKNKNALHAEFKRVLWHFDFECFIIFTPPSYFALSTQIKTVLAMDSHPPHLNSHVKVISYQLRESIRESIMN